MASPDQIVTNAIQTNGTPLDDPWGEFLGTNGFLVGISIDGPAQWHDRFRRDGDNEPTFHRAWAGLELLRKHHVEFNVLATLNSANAPHAGDVYRYFVNHGVTYLQFIPILERTVEGRPTNFSCTPEQFGRFMLEVFEQWATRDVGRVSERFIDSVLHTLIHGQASLCCYAKRCANAFVLEWNGDLYACDHFVYPQWRIGNIQERPLSELVRDDLVEQFAAQKTQLSHRCRDCEYQSFCFGGCPKHHVPIGTDGSRVNHFCEGYRLFFREALPELRRMAKYIERGEMPPLRPAAPRPGASSQQTSPERPGRNDPCPCRSRRKFKNCCGRN